MSKKSLQIERIAEAADLEKLKEIWNALLERNATRTVELTYEWQMTYWKHFKQNAELFILVVKADEAVIALAPLKLTKTGLPGIPIRTLEFIAASESNYQDFIIGENSDAVLATLRDYLKCNNLWERLKLNHVPESSPTARFFLDSQSIPFLHRVAEVERCTYLETDGSWEKHVEGLHKKKREHTINNRRRALQKFGDIILYHCTDKEQLEFDLQSFFALHCKRWNPTDTPSQFNDKRYREFYLEVSPQLQSKGQVDLFVLRVDNTPVALLYSFLFREDCQWQLITYDTDYSRGSPAIILQEAFVKEAFTTGIRTIDDGYYYHYKELWADKMKNRLNIEVYPKKPISYLFYGFKCMLSFLKMNLKKIGPLRSLVRYIRHQARTFSKRVPITTYSG